MKQSTFFLIGLILVLISSCTTKAQELDIIDTFTLDIKEPSGLSYHDGYLYIVSDRNGTIYKTNTKGLIKEKIKSSLKDVEGIAYQISSDRFLLVEEGKRMIAEVARSGAVLSRHSVSGNQVSKNSGLEGICFKNRDEIFVVNEKKPKALLKLNSDYEVVTEQPLNFGKDVSGCAFDKQGNLWIVSDQSYKIYKVSEEGIMQEEYRIPVEKAEGIVLAEDKIFIVSDSESRLYTFKLPE